MGSRIELKLKMIPQAGSPRKRLAILLFVVFVLSLLALAAGLSRVHFAPGKPYSLPGRPPASTVSLELPGDRWKDYLNLIFWSISGLILIAGLIAAIFSKEYRRELLITLLAVLPVILIGIFGLRAYLRSHPELPELPEQPQPPQPEELPQAPLQEPSHIPSWSSFLLFVVLLAAAGLILWRVWPHLRPREETLSELAGLAGSAAADLRAGKELKDTIMRCYREMSELLARRGHIPEEVRKVLTPREFEAELRKLGMADEHVARLSRLFERVRYGGRRPSPAEEQEAIACLEAIERAYGQGQPRRLSGEAISA